MAERNIKETCATCKFICHYKPYLYECRRNPPVSVSGDNLGSFTRINNEWWCGEYKPVQPNRPERRRNIDI